MEWVTFGVFVGAPLLIALTAPLWFWRIPAFMRLRERARALDQDTVTPSGPAVTLKKLRETDGLGDKVVVAHHLIRVGEDFVYRLVQAFVLGAAFTALLAIIIAIGVESAKEDTRRGSNASYAAAATPTAKQGTAAAIADDAGSVGNVLRRTRQYLALPLGSVAAFLWSLGSLFAFHNHLFWYRGVLAP